jgi:hypothetical protein
LEENSRSGSARNGDAAREVCRDAGIEHGVAAIGQDVDEEFAIHGVEIASSLRSSQ